MRNKLFIIISSVAALMFAFQASAHAVVSPKQANVAAFTDFSLGVPSEKPIATITVRLLIPDGLNFVSPYVKPGWHIDVKTGPAQAGAVAADGDTETTRITEIDWTGGNIPAGEKDEFKFSAQVPAQASTLNWKVYQTYQDGSVVSWDQAPGASQPMDASGKMDFSKVGPYSTTEVINDLAAGAAGASGSQAGSNATDSASSTKVNASLALSIVALVFALWATRKKTPQN
jgi:uncharacterized protein YcnI